MLKQMKTLVATNPIRQQRESVLSNGLKGRAACSPLPSPSERGGSVSRLLGFPSAPDSRTRWSQLSLSPGERAGVRGKATSEHLRLPICRALLASALALTLALGGISLVSAQVTPPAKGQLAFSASGTNGFTFDTGVLKGKLRAGGKSRGLSSVVHVPTGITLDSSMGLFGHYRVFSANTRYGTAAWDWPSDARLRQDGCVEVRWPSAEDRPFELRAVYRWAAPNILDLETSVQAKTNLTKFESFLGSYFAEGFTNACVCVRSNDQQRFEVADRSYGIWQAFPRDDQAALIILDGRWKYQPSPVDWAIRPPLAKPLGIRRCPASDLSAVLMSPPQDCFAVLTPFETESHLSMYLSLFGKDLKTGETARARARLVIGTRLAGETVDRLYADYLRQSR
jgi:hypothetical protein